MTKPFVARVAAAAFRQLPGRLSADPCADVELGELSVRFARLHPGPRTPHRHPHSVEVIYVIEGDGVCWQNGETARVSPGDVVVVPRGTAHATIPDPDSELLLFCVFPVGDLPGNIEELDGVIELSR
ncbi:MAG: cupin domain-containing protein [Gaiellaceae bacterium]